MGGAYLSSHPTALPRAGERCLPVRVGVSSCALFITALSMWPSFQLMVSPQREMSSPRRSLVLPACLKRTTPISNHSDLPLLQIPKMILSDAFTFLSCFQNTWRSMWAQPRLPHSAPSPSTVLGAQLELSQYQSRVLEALWSQALCTDHLTEFSQQPRNIGAILVPILHTGKLRLREAVRPAHTHTAAK